MPVVKAEHQPLLDAPKCQEKIQIDAIFQGLADAEAKLETKVQEKLEGLGRGPAAELLGNAVDKGSKIKDLNKYVLKGARQLEKEKELVGGEGISKPVPEDDFDGGQEVDQDGQAEEVAESKPISGPNGSKSSVSQDDDDDWWDQNGQYGQDTTGHDQDYQERNGQDEC